MKRILLSMAAVVVMVTMASAQLIQRNPDAQLLMPRAEKAPVAKVLGPNQLYMGAYASDALAESGLGLTAYEGVFQMGTVLPMEVVEPFMGGVVKAIRFGLCAPITDGAVFVYPVTSLSPLTLGEALVEQEVAATVTGWNQVELTNPFTISTDGIVGLMIGYQYKQVKGSTNECYPISVVEEGTILASYTNAGSLTNNTWQDIGLSDYGNLSVQAIVENENFPAYNLVMSNLANYGYAKISDGLVFSVGLSNFGIAQSLDNYTIDMLVDGEVKATLDSPVALTLTGTAYQGICPLEGVAPGEHTFTLQVKTVAGETVENGTALSTAFVAYTSAFERQKQLVEHFTSTTCTYCPLGANVLKALEQICEGKLARASVHVNIPSSGDPYVIAKGTNLASYLGVSSAPSAVFNRFDAELSGELPQTLGYYEQYAQMAAQMLKEQFFDNNPTPALATVNIDPIYDETTRQLAIKVTGKLSEDFSTIFGSTMGMTVYVTEDSLVARQLNQGTWVSDYVHDYVVRAIPSAYSGDAISVSGKTDFEKGYVVTLNSAWNPAKMHIVALAHRRGSTASTRQVINCEMVPLLSAGLTGDVTGDGLVDIADVNAVINMMLGKTENTAAADVTGDGDVDIADVNAVINLMLGK